MRAVAKDICAKPIVSFILNSVCKRLAPIILDSIREFSSATSGPPAVPATIRNVAMNAARATLDSIPKPSHAMNKGAKAT
jgi:hypothetical protein